MRSALIPLVAISLGLAACGGGSSGSDTIAAEQNAVDNPAPTGTPVTCGESCFLSPADGSHSSSSY